MVLFQYTTLFSATNKMSCISVTLVLLYFPLSSYININNEPSTHRHAHQSDFEMHCYHVLVRYTIHRSCFIYTHSCELEFILGLSSQIFVVKEDMPAFIRFYAKKAIILVKTVVRELTRLITQYDRTSRYVALYTPH